MEKHNLQSSESALTGVERIYQADITSVVAKSVPKDVDAEYEALLNADFTIPGNYEKLMEFLERLPEHGVQPIERKCSVPGETHTSKVALDVVKPYVAVDNNPLLDAVFQLNGSDEHASVALCDALDNYMCLKDTKRSAQAVYYEKAPYFNAFERIVSEMSPACTSLLLYSSESLHVEEKRCLKSGFKLSMFKCVHIICTYVPPGYKFDGNIAVYPSFESFLKKEPVYQSRNFLDWPVTLVASTFHLLNEERFVDNPQVLLKHCALGAKFICLTINNDVFRNTDYSTTRSVVFLGYTYRNGKTYGRTKHHGITDYEDIDHDYIDLSSTFLGHDLFMCVHHGKNVADNFITNEKLYEGVFEYSPFMLVTMYYSYPLPLTNFFAPFKKANHKTVPVAVCKELDKFRKVYNKPTPMSPMTLQVFTTNPQSYYVAHKKDGYLAYVRMHGNYVSRYYYDGRWNLHSVAKLQYSGISEALIQCEYIPEDNSFIGLDLLLFNMVSHVSFDFSRVVFSQRYALLQHYRSIGYMPQTYTALHDGNLDLTNYKLLVECGHSEGIVFQHCNSPWQLVHNKWGNFKSGSASYIKAFFTYTLWDNERKLWSDFIIKDGKFEFVKVRPDKNKASSSAVTPYVTWEVFWNICSSFLLGAHDDSRDLWPYVFSSTGLLTSDEVEQVNSARFNYFAALPNSSGQFSHPLIDFLVLCSNVLHEYDCPCVICVFNFSHDIDVVLKYMLSIAWNVEPIKFDGPVITLQKLALWLMELSGKFTLKGPMMLNSK